MATQSWSTVPENATDASFRAWGSGICTALENLGVIKTSDTGQINWATVTKPTGAYESKGYEIRKFNDSLQASYPVFIKLEFGSSGLAGNPGLWVTIGTGTNGAGTITGVLFSRLNIDLGNSGSSTYTSRASGNSGRFVIWWLGSTGGWSGSYPVFFLSVERSHDHTGADTGEGIMVWTHWHNQASGWAQFCKFSGSTTLYTRPNLAMPASGTGASGADVSVYPLRWWNPGESIPSVQVFGYFNVDLTAHNTVSATLWQGSTITIWPTACNPTNFAYGGSGMAVAIRYD